jgi:hypothetical protein
MFEPELTLVNECELIASLSITGTFARHCSFTAIPATQFALDLLDAWQACL